MAENDNEGQAGDPAKAKPWISATLGVIGLQGHIDAIESGRVYGWAWNPEQSAQRIGVDIYLRGDLIGSVLADRFRQDLVDVKVGDGSHAFVFDLPVDAREADPASVAVYFTDTQMPLSRGGPSLLPLRDRDVDPGITLSGRIDRIEASVQQMFRALHIIRRSDDDPSRAAGLQELEDLRKTTEKLTSHGDLLAERVEGLETATNAAQSFIDRFDIELHDRITRSEIEGVHDEIRRTRNLSRAVGILLLTTIAVFGYALFLQG